MPDASKSARPTLRALDGSGRRDDVERARAGDVGAWSALYDDAFTPVYRHLCYLTGDPTLAEDLTQESFACAFASIGEFDGRASFVGWVRGIGLNLARMHWRRSETKARVHASLTQLREMAPPRPGEDPVLVHQQTTRMQQLYEVLSEIPEHLREVFILRELEGLPAREVGEMLGITANNVGVRANRARAKIRAGLQRRGWLTEGAGA